jgi:hypothetical protein
MNAIILTQEEHDRLTEKVDAIFELLNQKEQSPIDGLIDNDQFIKTMGISKRCAQNWRDSGAISFRQYGKRIYYTPSDIEEFLEQNKNQAFKIRKI